MQNLETRSSCKNAHAVARVRKRGTHNRELITRSVLAWSGCTGPSLVPEADEERAHAPASRARVCERCEIGTERVSKLARMANEVFLPHNETSPRHWR